MSRREFVGRTGGYAVDAVVDDAGRACVNDGGVVRDVALARAHAQLVLRACRRAQEMAQDQGAEANVVEMTARAGRRR